MVDRSLFGNDGTSQRYASRLAGSLVDHGCAAPVASCADTGAVVAMVAVVRVVASPWRRRVVMMMMGLSHGNVLLVIIVFARGLGAEAHLGLRR